MSRVIPFERAVARRSRRLATVTATSTLAVAIAVLWAAAPALGADDDAPEVRRVFSAYRDALLAGEGSTAAALLSHSTYDYYDEMRKLALYGAPETVRAKPLIDQMQVLMFRLRVPTERLEALSPEGLIAHAVDRGWIGRNAVLKVRPGEVELDEDRAVLHVRVDDRDAGEFQLAREAEGWRIDLVPTTQASNVALERAAEQRGVPGSDLVLVLLESIVGRTLDDSAWLPPRTAAKP